MLRSELGVGVQPVGQRGESVEVQVRLQILARPVLRAAVEVRTIDPATAQTRLRRADHIHVDVVAYVQHFSRGEPQPHAGGVEDTGVRLAGAVFARAQLEWAARYDARFGPATAWVGDFVAGSVGEATTERLALRWLYRHEAQYLPITYGRGLMPETFTDYKKQRFRWAYGAFEVMVRGGGGSIINFASSLGMVGSAAMPEALLAAMALRATGATLVTIERDDAVKGGAFSPDGTMVLTFEGAGEASVWDARDGTPLFRQVGPIDRHAVLADAVRALRVAPLENQHEPAAVDVTPVWVLGRVERHVEVVLALHAHAPLRQALDHRLHGGHAPGAQLLRVGHPGRVAAAAVEIGGQVQALHAPNVPAGSRRWLVI